jgi:two-component system, OmpR family, copper resistance phosphate regulon response regulator CusR
VFEQPKRALVVEDEAKTAAFLRDGLQDHGWSVDVAKDGSDGLRLALKHNYDLLLLDVMLPTLDGWTILSRLREVGRFAPAIFLTARDEVSDRIKGLDLGADDYLVKPFAFSELLARIRSIMRRGPDRLPTNIKVAELEINLLTHVATRGPKQLELTQKEFALLVLLARNTGEILGRKFIAKEIWKYRFSLGGIAGAIDRQDRGIPYVARQYVPPNRSGRKRSATEREISLRDCTRYFERTATPRRL